MFSSLISHISEIVVVIDLNGVIRYANPQLERVFGLTEEVVGRNIFEFIHPDDALRGKVEYSGTVQKSGEGVPSFLRFRDASGEWIPFEIIANNRLDDPDVQGVVFSARDLRYRREIEETIRRVNTDVEKQVSERTTELAKANAALRLENQYRLETERRLQRTVSLLGATLDSTADGILVVSNDGSVSSWNKRFTDMWNLPYDPAVGCDDREMLSLAADQMQNPGEFLGKVQALYSDKSATGIDVLHFKDGRIFDRYSQPQRLDDQIIGRVWSFRDVTQERHLEEDLRHSQKMEAVGRLAGGVAHDFNNLLMLISGYLGRLSACGLSPEQEPVCGEALSATKRATALTRQLLAFSHKHRDAPGVTDLNAIVSNIQEMLRPLIPASVRLDISLCDNPAPVLADIQQLEVVVMNLVINAQDAMPDGGVMSVVTTREEKGSLGFGVLTVSDTGRGMTPEVRAQIFEPFFTTKPVGRGTGLGLSTVHGIVQRSGGHIEVRSEPNCGTQVRIYLPQSAAAPDAGRATPNPAISSSQHETILLAEDEPGIREMTKVYLESLGYHVLSAPDGSEAVDISREYQGTISLILTDLHMPVLGGEAAVSAIRELRPTIRTLYITGYPEDRFVHDAAEVLLKPFEFPELGLRVRLVLDAD
jgi:PAS domain S-box-containing protein